MMHRVLGVGGMVQRCPISILQPNLSGWTVPEEGVWYPGVRLRRIEF